MLLTFIATHTMNSQHIRKTCMLFKKWFHCMEFHSIELLMHTGARLPARTANLPWKLEEKVTQTEVTLDPSFMIQAHFWGLYFCITLFIKKNQTTSLFSMPLIFSGSFILMQKFHQKVQQENHILRQLITNNWKRDCAQASGYDDSFIFRQG